jgi:hypothetical protein
MYAPCKKRQIPLSSWPYDGYEKITAVLVQLLIFILLQKLQSYFCSIRMTYILCVAALAHGIVGMKPSLAV